MTITIENILLIGSLLLLISVIVGKPSYKFGVPTLLIFLVPTADAAIREQTQGWPTTLGFWASYAAPWGLRHA